MNLRIPTTNTRFFTLLSGFALVLGLASAGCGGGGHTAASAPASDTRAASIATVQGTRKVARLMGVATDTRDVVVGDGPLAPSLTPTLDTLRRLVRPLNFIGRSTGRNTQTASFDSGLGLYRTETVSDNQVNAQYFEDGAMTRPVGTTQATVADNGQVKIVFDIQGGKQPTQGTLSMTMSDRSAQTGKITGEIGNPRTGGKVAVDLKFSGDVMSGALAVSTVGTVKMTNVISYSDGHLEADVAYAGTNGHLSQLADLSGTLALNDSLGKTVATYASNGTGTVQLSNGQSADIADFDAGS